MRTSYSPASLSRPKLGIVILAGILAILAAGQVSASTASPRAPSIQSEAR
jgi:hypothetical protein